MAYVASLEERLRSYEQNGVQANVQLQKLAKKLDSENRKLKKAIFELSGIGDIEIERAGDAEALVEEIRSRMGPVSNLQSPRSMNGATGIGSRSSSFSGGMVDGIWGYGPSTPFSSSGIPTAQISDVRSQKPPTPPPTKEGSNAAQSLLLTLAPTSTPDCAEGFGPEGKRFCGLLKLLATESNKLGQPTASIPCRLSFELLQRLINEQDPLAIENAAFELKDGLSLEDGSCNVDAKVLAKVLNRLTDSKTPSESDDSRIGMMVNA